MCRVATPRRNERVAGRQRTPGSDDSQADRSAGLTVVTIASGTGTSCTAMAAPMPNSAQLQLRGSFRRRWSVGDDEGGDPPRPRRAPQAASTPRDKRRQTPALPSRAPPAAARWTTAATPRSDDRPGRHHVVSLRRDQCRSLRRETAAQRRRRRLQRDIERGQIRKRRRFDRLGVADVQRQQPSAPVAGGTPEQSLRGEAAPHALGQTLRPGSVQRGRHRSPDTVVRPT